MLSEPQQAPDGKYGTIDRVTAQNKDNRGCVRRWSIGSIAVAAAVFALLTGAAVYSARMLSDAWQNVGRFAELVPEPSAGHPPDTAGGVSGIRDTAVRASTEESRDATPPAAAAVLADIERLGATGELSTEALAALAGIEPVEVDDELLIIERGIPSTMTASASTGQAPAAWHRKDSARYGSEPGMRDIIENLGSEDPGTSAEAWSALRRMAHSGNAASFEALLADAEIDPLLHERASELLRSLPYD